MSSDESTEEIDTILDILSKPLSRFILSVLVGKDPGVFKGSIDITEDDVDEAI